MGVVKIKVSVVPERLIVPPQVKRTINEVLLQTNIANIRAGLDWQDRPFPPGVSMVKTGNTINTARADEKAYRFLTEYSSINQARYSFAGVSSANYKKVEPRLQSIIDSAKLSTKKGR